MQLPNTVEGIVAFLGVLRAGMIATSAQSSMLRGS
jgi:acyl-CoA synthetase (AMP-forming)/AMP-acid ligase II